MATARLRLGVVLITLTAVGALVGNGTAWCLAGVLDTRVPARPSLHTAAPFASAPADPCALLDRPALFGRFPDVACGVHAGGVIAPTHPAGPLAPCPTTLRLVGAVVPRAGEPFAAIVDATGASLLYTEGMPIGDHEVAAIEPQRVVLARDETRCLLSMFEPRGAPTASLAAVTDDEAGRVSITATGARRVPRALVARLASSGELLTTLRAIPHQAADGSVDGYRIFGVRRESPTAQLGIENGDVITHVDDVAIDGVGSAIDALGRVQTASHASLRVIRGGHQETLSFDIE
jgi:type II secretory pathway component PulC